MEHDGHRSRMRQRFMQTGLEGFADHEILELLLFYAIPRRDVNPLAHQRLDTFGSLINVLEASPQQLKQVPGMGESAASLLALMVPVFRRYTANVSSQRVGIFNRGDCKRYCLSLLAGRRNEHFYVIGLDASSEIAGTSLICTGDLSEVPAYPRQVVQAVLSMNAHSVIFCHNHPGGNLRASDSDVEATQMLIEALYPINVGVLDHVIVSRGNCIFLSDLNRLPFVTNRELIKAAEQRAPRRKDMSNVQNQVSADW